MFAEAEMIAVVAGVECLIRVRLDKTQIEHNESAYTPTAALKRTF